MPIAPVFPGPSAGGGNNSTVTAPSATSQSVSAGASLSNKTFSAFTDSGGLIDESNYLAVVTNAVGSSSISSRTDRGPYVFGNNANGNTGTLSLTARDSSNNALATATHTFSIAAAASGVTLADLVDFSGTSYNFLTTGGGGSGGAGAHTVGGLSVTLDYRGTSGPSALAMSSGTIACTLSSGNKAYLIIDIGADVDDSPWVVNGVATNVASGGSSAAIFWQVADDTTIPHNTGHFQWLLGDTGVTKLLERECTRYPSLQFTTANSRTITDYTTTPTRMQGIILGDYVQLSFDQGTASLPAVDGKQLGTAGPEDWRGPSGVGTPGNRRYIHLQFNNFVGSAEFKIQAYRLRTA